MKICKLLLLLVIIQATARAQQATSAPESVETEIFWLDLCTPRQLHSVTRPQKGRKRYEVNWKNNLSFGLTNINQFKYNYKINSVPFAAFVDTAYGSFSTSLLSIIDANKDPFFDFSIKVKSPIKDKFKRLTQQLDSLISVSQAQYKATKTITSKYDREAELRKNAADWKSYSELRVEAAITDQNITSLRDQINKISYKQQFEALKRNFDKLSDIEARLLGDTSFRELIGNYYSDLPGQNEELFTINKSGSSSFGGEAPDYTSNISRLLTNFQQNAQYIRLFLNQFEIQYEYMRNKLNNWQCKSYTRDEKDGIERLINLFNDTKYAFVELNDLYAISPLQDEYLEGYLVKESQYVDKLFSQYMGIARIKDVDTTYITPAPTNMKNFDMIKIELEKIDKQSNQTEKYEYDIFIKGGLKVDFSAGIFTSFLKNDEYNLVDSLGEDGAPTNRKMIRRKDNGGANIGFGGMVNIGIRSGASWISPGISFGLLLDTKPSLQFLSAFTLALGKTERLLLHGGVALGFVKRVDGLPVDKYIPSAQIGSVVPTVDKFLARPFLGISYNLSKNSVFKVTSFTTSESNGEKE